MSYIPSQVSLSTVAEYFKIKMDFELLVFEHNLQGQIPRDKTQFTT